MAGLTGSKGGESSALLNYSKCCSQASTGRAAAVLLFWAQLCTAFCLPAARASAGRVPLAEGLPPLGVGHLVLLTSWPTLFSHLLLLLTGLALLPSLLPVTPALSLYLSPAFWCGFAGSFCFTFSFLLFFILVYNLWFVSLRQTVALKVGITDSW